MKKITYLSLIVLLAISSCTFEVPQKSDLPSWDIQLEVPLFKMTTKIDDLLNDSSIVKLPEGSDSVFAFQDTSQDIPRKVVGDQLNIPDIQQAFSQNIDDVSVEGSETHTTSKLDTVGVEPVNENVKSELGVISLADTDPQATDPIYFTDLIDLGDQPEGATVTVPKDQAIPTIYRDVTFNNFNRADFSGGFLEVTINNDLVIELGQPVEVQLLDEDSTIITGTDSEQAILRWTSPIAIGTSDTKTLTLALKTLPGQIIVKISGVVCSSGATDVTNNSTTRGSNFTVNVQARDLEVTLAEAIVPTQQIDTLGIIELAESENKVESAEIQEGNLAININNQLGVDATLQLTIVSIADNADGSGAFYQEIDLPAKTITNNTYDLNTKYLVMDVNDQKVQYNYRVITTDTGNDMATVASDDSIVVDIKLFGIDESSDMSFSRFTGFVVQDPIEENEAIDITTDSEIVEAGISSGSITITVANGVFDPALAVPELTLDIPEIVDATGNPIHEVRSLSGTAVIDIPLAGYKLRPNTVIVNADSFTQNITYRTYVEIPSTEKGRYHLTDSIAVDVVVSDMSFNYVTGYFDQKPIVERDSISLDEGTKIDVAKIRTGVLELRITNNIQAEADVEFSILDIVNKSTLAPLTFSTSLSNDPSNPQVEAIDLTPYQIDLDYNSPTDSQFVRYTSKISIPSENEMTLQLGQNIDVAINLKDLNFSEIIGYIDTIDINIDPVEQEMPDLLKELQGIELENVSISLDFDTNIGVDFLIDLTMESSNNEEGTSASTHITQWIRQDDDSSKTVVIPNAEELLNITPDSLRAFGYAKVYGPGNVNMDQFVDGKINIEVPLILNIGEDAEIEVDQNLVKDGALPDQVDAIESVELNMDVNNGFDFGGIIDILAARDTSYFLEGSPVAPDTLLSFDLAVNQSFQDAISLGQDQFDLFTDSLYIKPVIRLQGREDGQPSKLMRTDSMTIQLNGTIRLNVDFDILIPDSTDEEGDE